MATKSMQRLLLAMLLVGTASTVAAQEASSGSAWRHGTTIGLFGGAATAEGDAGPVMGGAIGWEVQPWFGIDGSGSWLDRPHDAEAFAASIAARASLAAVRRFTPYVRGGFGLYHASFENSTEPLPAFYQRRIAPDALRTSYTFTDPAFVFGAGLQLFSTRHVAIQPDIEAMVVTNDGRHQVVTAFTVHVAYHFEDHPVTPRRR